MAHILSKIWESVVKEHPDSIYLKISKDDELKARSIPYRWFYNKALRLAVVFREDLKLTEGQSVAILSNEPDEYVLLLMAAWIAGLVAVPIPKTASLDLQIHYLNSTRAAAFVFPPTASAKLVSLFSKLKTVKHWCVMGAAARGAAPVAGIIRLEDLARSQVDEFKELPKIGPATPALRLKSNPLLENDPFITYTQVQLIEASKATSNLYISSLSNTNVHGNSKEKSDNIAWTSFALETLDGIVHNFLVPLFLNNKENSYSFLVSSTYDQRRLWDQISSEGISLIVVNQLELKNLYKRATLRNWQKPEKLTIFLYSSETLSVDLIENFQERCKFSVRPFYRKTILGGVLTMFPASNDENYCDEWLCDYEIPSSGIPLPGVTFQIRDLQGAILPEQTMGEIVVRCTIGSIFKKLPETYAPSIKRVSDDFVRTGDEGFYVKDTDGQPHIFVVGRLEDVIERQGERISPGRITNIVGSLKEVESVVVVGFPNRHVGYEVGAYVIPIPAAQIGEKALRQKLLEKLDWEDCPKVIIFGTREKSGLPDKEELIKHFDRFYEINYVSEPT